MIPCLTNRVVLIRDFAEKLKLLGRVILQRLVQHHRLVRHEVWRSQFIHQPQRRSFLFIDDRVEVHVDILEHCISSIEQVDFQVNAILVEGDECL